MLPFAFIVYITNSLIKTCAYTSNLAGFGQVDDKTENIRTTKPRNALLNLTVAIGDNIVDIERYSVLEGACLVFSQSKR